MPPRRFLGKRRPMARRGPRKGYRTYRKSRYSRKKTYQKVVEIKRTVNKQWTLNSNALATNNGLITQLTDAQNIQYTFQLSDIPSYEDITKLYDMYKIKSIRLRLIPYSNDVSIPNYASPVHSVLDFSDQTNLTSMQDYMDYSTYRCTQGVNRQHVRFFYPKQIQYLNDGGVATQGSLKNTWVRSESPGIDHLGVKLFLQGGATTPCYYQVQATYYILAKNTK